MRMTLEYFFDLPTILCTTLQSADPQAAPRGTGDAEGAVNGAIEPLGMAIGCLLLLLASLAAHGSAGLQAYSPTKLQKVLGPNAARTLELLRLHELEFRILARFVMLAAVTGSVWIGSQSVSGLLGRLVFAGLCLGVVFFVAVLPAAVAERGPERVVRFVLPILHPLRVLLHYPLIWPLVRLCRPVLRAMKIPDQPPTDPDEIADEILAAVSDSAEGELEEEEKAWIGNIVELKELHASEVMTPRTDIHAINASTPIGDAIRLAVEKGHSRFPVYRETVDNVVGVFYAKDVLAEFAKDRDISATTVSELTREPLFAPESMRVSDLLREFKTSTVQMAIVIDEYGGTAGLITIEDVLEEIVGEITDEFDPEEEAPITIIQGEQVIEVSGKTRVEEANEALGADLILEGEDYDTVGGFVFSHLGQIPEVETSFQVQGLEVKILAVENRRVSRVRLTVLTALPSDT